MLRRTVGRMATLDTVAEQGNVPLNVLTQDIADEVERQTGARPPIADVADAETIDPARLADSTRSSRTSTPARRWRRSSRGSRS